MSSLLKAVVKQVKAVGSAALPGSSPVQEFQAVCEEADNFLETLSKEFELPLNEIAATREQLQNKEILISAFGRHNAGKSTLLNALLHNELLPMNLRNETGIRVNIQHNSEMHKGTCGTSCHNGRRLLEERGHGEQEVEYCPELHTEGQLYNPTCGSGRVYEKLKEANMKAKTSRGQTEPTHYTIVGNIPALADAPKGWRVMMTDNPGFGEAHQEYITQLAETSLKTSTAYLYVVDVGQLQDKVDAHSFELLHAKDKDVFSNKRVVIAVTQFDKTFSPLEHNQMSEEDTKRIVCDMIESSTGVKASQDLVVPVYSLWAFVARKFRHSQGDSNLHHYTVSELGKCPRGQQEILERLEPAILANRLEAKSGIDILEERVRGMTGACAEIWAIAMTKNYCSYLGGAMEGVEKLLDSTRKTFQERSTNLKHLLEQYKFIERLRNELIQSKEAGSAVYQDLLQKSQKDVKGLKASLSQRTNEFAKMCKEKIENGEETFGPEEFKKDLETFREEVTTELQKAADAKCVFKETCAAYQAHVEAIGKVFMQITSTAQKLLAAVEVHMYNATTDKGMTDFSEFFQVRKISPTDLTAKVPIPELTLTHFETTVWFMRQTFSWLFGPPKYSYKSHECLSDPVKKLRLRVLITAKIYLADIERHAANHFFEGYCKVVNRELQAFEGDFQKITRLKEKEEAIVKRLEEDVKKYEYWQQRLKELQSRLEEKRKKYCASLQHQFDHGGMD